MSDELRTSEFEALRRELEATSKRTYDAVFFAITAASLILGYALTENQKWVALVPLLVLFGTYQIVRQSIRSQRRIVAYLRVFHESLDRGAMWETILYWARKKFQREREKGINRTLRLLVAAQIGLLWAFGCASIIVFGWLTLTEGFTWPLIVLVACVALLWVAIGWSMTVNNKELTGAGSVERAFEKQIRNVISDLKSGQFDKSMVEGDS